MQFIYIDDNLNKVLENQDNVMYLRPFDVYNKKALFAVIKEDDGVYKKVQITKEQSKITFPFEPIFWFYQENKSFNLKNYIIFCNNLAFNITNLEGFEYKMLDNSKLFDVEIFATFNDGSATFIMRNTIREFLKKGGIQSYTDLLKQHKDCSKKHNNYMLIENNNYNNDTFIIPELQTKETNSKVKKLIKK